MGPPPGNPGPAQDPPAQANLQPQGRPDTGLFATPESKKGPFQVTEPAPSLFGNITTRKRLFEGVETKPGLFANLKPGTNLFGNAKPAEPQEKASGESSKSPGPPSKSLLGNSTHSKDPEVKLETQKKSLEKQSKEFAKLFSSSKVNQQISGDFAGNQQTLTPERLSLKSDKGKSGVEISPKAVLFFRENRAKRVVEALVQFLFEEKEVAVTIGFQFEGGKYSFDSENAVFRKMEHKFKDKLKLKGSAHRR